MNVDRIHECMTRAAYGIVDVQPSARAILRSAQHSIRVKLFHQSARHLGPRPTCLLELVLCLVEVPAPDFGGVVLG